MSWCVELKLRLHKQTCIYYINPDYIMIYIHVYVHTISDRGQRIMWLIDPDGRRIPVVSPWLDKPRMIEPLKYEPKLTDEESWHTGTRSR